MYTTHSTEDKEEFINRQHCSATLAVSSCMEICLEILTSNHCTDGAFFLTYMSTSLLHFDLFDETMNFCKCC